MTTCRPPPPPVAPIGGSVGVTASGPGGSIYDLGYQGYTGPRLGRRSAVAGAASAQSLRACYGIGRGGRAKIAPFTLAGSSPSCRPCSPSASRRSPPRPGRQPAPSETPRRSATRPTTASSASLDHAVLRRAGARAVRARPALRGPAALLLARPAPGPTTRWPSSLGLIVALFAGGASPRSSSCSSGASSSRPIRPPGSPTRSPRSRKFLLQAVLVAGLAAAASPRSIAAWHAAPRLRHGGDHRDLHHPADHRRHRRRPDQLGDLARVLILFSPADVLDGTNAAIFGSIPDGLVVAQLDLPGWAYVAAARRSAIVGDHRADGPALPADRGMTAEMTQPTDAAPVPATAVARSRAGTARRAPAHRGRPRLALVRQRRRGQRHLVRPGCRASPACSARTAPASRRSCT